MGSIADGQTAVVPSTIEDASVLDSLRLVPDPETPAGGAPNGGKHHQVPQQAQRPATGTAPADPKPLEELQR